MRFSNSNLYGDESEQIVLSILLSNNTCVDKVVDFLRAEHFYNDFHSALYKTIVSTVQKGFLANSVTLSPFFPDQSEYILELSSNNIFSDHIEDYANQIFEYYLRRKIVDIGSSMCERAAVFESDGLVAMEQIEKAESSLFQLATKGTTTNFVDFSHALDKSLKTAEIAFKKCDGLTGISTGFNSLDRFLGGLQRSDLIIIAGRPSMGKTAFATNIAFNAASLYQKTNGSEGARVAFFSLEMSSEQLATRLLSQESCVSSSDIRRGSVSESEFMHMIDTAKKINNVPLFIDDAVGINLVSLRARIRRMCRKNGIDMVVIDYLQLLTSGGKTVESRLQEISEITRGLKSMAKEFSIPIIALSQLSRAVEQRDDKTPQLSDLRESGTIEQDSDVVMFVYREEYYESRRSPSSDLAMAKKIDRLSGIKNKADIVIAKQRHGAIGTVTMRFDGNLTKFSD